jgi:para-aminobenzoate synthetase / 4-amino-4-deoxychorismate lyase
MILLDDSQSTSSKPSSRLYEAASHSWCIYPSDTDEQSWHDVNDCLTEISSALSRGEFVVAAFAYELGNLIHRLPSRISRHPLIQAWSFDSYQALSKDQVDDLIASRLVTLDPSDRTAGVLDLHESITEEHFTADIERIQEYIRCGDTYQINHTYRIQGKSYGSPLALYSLLRKRQPGRFGALIENTSQFILSQSPELFIQRQGNLITAMPMKGTASAFHSSADQLSNDPKNRAENLMIVDLLRNDLGRLAIPGSVNTPKLFEVARHGDVLQMTSTVQAELKPETSLSDILQAVFPCGSVTGAPKKRSMQIIQDLEPVNRGYYCGALGWLDPNGDFALSVPIRTIEIQEDPHTHTSTLSLGIGAGITIDSVPKQEWQECHIKSSFLTDLPSGVGLFETILVKDCLPQLLDLHLKRITASASALGIPFQESDAQEIIAATCMTLSSNEACRLRLDLEVSGKLSCALGLLEPLPATVKLFWAKDLLKNPADAIMFSGNALLPHKSTHRKIYDDAWKAAVSKGGFDALFTNEQGFITEGGRSSIFIKTDKSDRWLTPPLSAGVLPGVMRASMLANSQWNICETNLTVADVLNAKEIMLSNALRGPMSAYF